MIRALVFIIVTAPLTLPSFLLGTVLNMMWRAFVRGWQDGVESFSNWSDDL